MNKQEKITFIETLTETLKQDMLSKIDRMPEEWDGLELRYLMKDKGAECVWAGMGNKQRLRAYRNDCRVKGI